VPAVTGGDTSGDGSAGGVPTRARLVDAASELFNKQPYSAVHIAEISARAGVTPGSFYSYFQSKEVLFREVAERALEELYSYGRSDPGNAEGNPVRDIAYGIRQYFQVVSRLRVIAESIEQVYVVDDDVRMTRRGTVMRGAKRIERWIVRLQQAGVCPPDIDAWLTALALQTMTINLGYDQLVRRDRPQDIDALVAAVTPIWARSVGLERWLAGAL
jgi:AcrR family transcriptional regulator